MFSMSYKRKILTFFQQNKKYMHCVRMYLFRFKYIHCMLLIHTNHIEWSTEINQFPCQKSNELKKKPSAHTHNLDWVDQNSLVLTLINDRFDSTQLLENIYNNNNNSTTTKQKEKHERKGNVIVTFPVHLMEDYGRAKNINFEWFVCDLREEKKEWKVYIGRWSNYVEAVSSMHNTHTQKNTFHI